MVTARLRIRTPPPRPNLPQGDNEPNGDSENAPSTPPSPAVAPQRSSRRRRLSAAVHLSRASAGEIPRPNERRGAAVTDPFNLARDNPPLPDTEDSCVPRNGAGANSPILRRRYPSPPAAAPRPYARYEGGWQARRYMWGVFL